MERNPTADEPRRGGDAPLRDDGNVYRPMGNLLPYPYFSLEERDRRWRLTREAMDRDDIDCLVVPNNTGHSTHFQADARYLTHVGGGGDADVAAVFPFSGEPAAVATSAARWIRTQPWCTDLREASRAYGAGVVSKLRELSFPRRRIGVVGLHDYVRAPEGTAGYGFMKVLTGAFPGIDWVDFTRQMEEIRIVKSAEEIAFLEMSMQIVNAAYDAAVGVLRPGVMDYYVWGTAIETICRMGSEIPVHQHWIGDHHPELTLTRPTFREIEEGWLFLSEIEAAWGGYHAQGDQPFSCGQPDPMYLELMSYEIDVWNETFPHIVPGVTVRELQERVAATARRLSPMSGRIAGATASIVMHGRGLGSDPPIITGPGTRQRDLERTVAPGWCFVYKPAATAGQYRLSWGDTVVVTETGPRRLGRARQEIMIARW
ncbi:MAG: M24 family metallopeptidase [Chloroflexi bacterium]|nr:M24 family metallopeptidase [Chloroflexota bacterium]